ncbi:MAG TPA: SbcC/MukB-like Walker B domain-containing protein, partial [Candidatus Ozemobacteraceae bacterium]|nr:SbcC/MukB-like Walker B domain-containing protein [Candidatus Ozemobacteraceae bacterium]
VQTLQNIGGEMRSLAAEQLDAQKAMEARAREIEAAEQNVKRLEKELELLEASVEDHTVRKADCRTRASLEELRRLLQEGKPCPLCGALGHPYAVDGVDAASEADQADKLLKLAKAALKKAGDDLKEATKKCHHLATEQAGDQSFLKSHEKALAGLRKKWQKQAGLLDTPISPEDEAGLGSFAAALGTEYRKAEKAFEDFQTAVEKRDVAEKILVAINTRLQSLEKEQAEILGLRAKLDALIREANGQQAGLERQKEEMDAGLFRELLVYGIVEFDEEVIPKLQTRWEAWQKAQKELEDAGRTEQASRTELTAAESRLAGLVLQLQERIGQLKAVERTIAETGAKRREIYGDKNPDVEEEQWQSAQTALRQKEDASEQRVQEANLTMARLHAAEEQQAAALSALEKELADAGQKLADFLRREGFADQTALRSALLPPDLNKSLTELEKQLESRATNLQGRIEHGRRQISEYEAARPTTCTLEELIQEEALLAERVSLAMTAWQDQWKRWSVQKENRERHQELGDRIQAAECDRERWIKLCELIGSHDGKKFRDYAHGLTFANLVFQANQQMKKLNGRYLLANCGLELQVIDRHIADTRASAKNLSGGEKFLASLALALGLAQMVGRKHRMDTLFIDEGFGALDPDTLEMAVAALCGLQQQGKLIGVISHVESLKERLPVRLEVTRIGAGISTITGPGCRVSACR